MKIRVGFVTNSSSSSYILVGKRTKIEDVDLNSGKQYTFIGKSLCDGYDVIDLHDKDLYEYMLCNWHNITDIWYPEIFETTILCDSDYSLPGKELIEKLDPKENYEFINVEWDYHSTETIEVFKTRYEI